MAKYNEGRLEMQGKSILIEEITVGMVWDDRGAYSFFGEQAFLPVRRTN